MTNRANDEQFLNKNKTTNKKCLPLSLVFCRSFRPWRRKKVMKCKWFKINKMKGLYTILLLIGSNIFMTLAWYGHLKLQQAKISDSWPLILVIVFSWAIALFEYSLQVPANRIGFEENGGPFSLVQLKVIQEVISLIIFAVVAMVMFQGVELKWNHIAAFGCLVMAVYFVFMK